MILFYYQSLLFLSISFLHEMLKSQLIIHYSRSSPILINLMISMIHLADVTSIFRFHLVQLYLHFLNPI
jgi:hypothetical protein